MATNNVPRLSSTPAGDSTSCTDWIKRKNQRGKMDKWICVRSTCAFLFTLLIGLIATGGAVYLYYTVPPEQCLGTCYEEQCRKIDQSTNTYTKHECTCPEDGTCEDKRRTQINTILFYGMIALFIFGPICAFYALLFKWYSIGFADRERDRLAIGEAAIVSQQQAAHDALMRQQLFEISGLQQQRQVYNLDADANVLNVDEEAQRYLADHEAAMAASLLEAEQNGTLSRSQRVEMEMQFRNQAGLSASGQLAASMGNGGDNSNNHMFDFMLPRPVVYKTTRVTASDIHEVVTDVTPIAEEFHQLLQVEEDISEFGYAQELTVQAVATHSNKGSVIADVVVI